MFLGFRKHISVAIGNLKKIFIVALQLGIANKSSTHAVIDEFFTVRTTTLN